jgi:hypothetical protein
MNQTGIMPDVKIGYEYTTSKCLVYMEPVVTVSIYVGDTTVNLFSFKNESPIK